MVHFSWLAVIPVALAFGGIFVANRVTPFLFGLPFYMAWVVGTVLITSLVMWIIYKLDPANKE